MKRKIQRNRREMQANAMKKRTRRKIIRKSSIPLRRPVPSTHSASRKKFTSEGWYYVLSGDESNDSDEFSTLFNPVDQTIVKKVWEATSEDMMKSENDVNSKTTVYHPVASPSTFPMLDEPMMIYGSMQSASRKQPEKTNLPHEWNSCDDTTLDPTDSRLQVEFSPHVSHQQHKRIFNNNETASTGGLKFGKGDFNVQSNERRMDADVTEIPFSLQQNAKEDTTGNQKLTTEDKSKKLASTHTCNSEFEDEEENTEKYQEPQTEDANCDENDSSEQTNEINPE